MSVSHTDYQPSGGKVFRNDMNDIPEDRHRGTGKVNIEECLDILRDIIANAENTDGRLERRLTDQFKADSYLVPHVCTAPAALIESAMKALGMPYPKAPKPRKVPDVPTPAQAEALNLMVSKDARLVIWYSRSRSGARIEGETVREPTAWALRDYKWIEKVADNPWGDTFYSITQAGREALERYKAKSIS